MTSAEDAFPRLEWMARLNAQRAQLGLPSLSMLDPLAMLLWHQQQESLRRPISVQVMTGC